MKWLLLMAAALTLAIALAFPVADLPTIMDEPDPTGIVEPPRPVTEG